MDSSGGSFSYPSLTGPKPCPTCGRCPTCGGGVYIPYYVHPNYTPVQYPNCGSSGGINIYSSCSKHGTSWQTGNLVGCQKCYDENKSMQAFKLDSDATGAK